MRVQKKHGAAAIALSALVVLGLSACTAPAAEESSEPTTPMTEEPMDMSGPQYADLVGPGCMAYAEQVPDGSGSIDGMAEAPVANAASSNPLLTTLVAAVSGQLNPDVNLVDTLNGGEFTVFAPVDDAFAKLDPATVESLKDPANAGLLTTILTYHVVPGQILPSDLVGTTQTTVEGEDVTIGGTVDMMTVNDANVICGGVHTANATVYLIDSVLLPPSAG
ncbi:MAG: fasciclin domain-containing protein [Actinomycetales bacterium]|nr:fasciclin domain-containing protein [Actinomycetales bacterium]